ncbi:MAG: hypothetical protein RL757_150 [Bacteroidota bacterium]
MKFRFFILFFFFFQQFSPLSAQIKTAETTTHIETEAKVSRPKIKIPKIGKIDWSHNSKLERWLITIGIALLAIFWLYLAIFVGSFLTWIVVILGGWSGSVDAFGFFMNIPRRIAIGLPLIGLAILLFTAVIWAIRLRKLKRKAEKENDKVLHEKWTASYKRWKMLAVNVLGLIVIALLMFSFSKEKK